MRLRDVQSALCGVFSSVPCRETLIGMIEDGTLSGYKTQQGHYVVYESSLRAWVKSTQPAVAAQQAQTRRPELQAA